MRGLFSQPNLGVVLPNCQNATLLRVLKLTSGTGLLLKVQRKNSEQDGVALGLVASGDFLRLIGTLGSFCQKLILIV